MAANQKTTSISSQVVYEDFQPKSEWVEDAAANILTVNLPGFTRDKIRITYSEKPPRMTVRGERLVREGTGSRFSKEFPIPENCRLNEMKAKFDLREVLTITMPKKIITQVVAQPKDTVPKEQKQRQQEDLSNRSSVAAPANDQTKPPHKKPQEKTGSSPESTAAPDATVAASVRLKEPEKKMDEKTQKAPHPDLPKPRIQEGKTPSKADGQKQEDDRVIQPFRPLEDTSRPNPQKIQKEISKTAAVPDAQKSTHEQGKSGQDQKPVDQNALKEKDHQPRGKEMASQIFERIGKETVEFAAAAKRAMVGMEEERKLLVNAGVAVLIIVAVGAYVGYKLSSSSGSQSRNN
ncbi:hypothetical protein SAY87_007809 [Trapa incisa]|uniref:SHSP domain-containing protein n=1 Tax=Trapa incisa TaxID=236973 RepID=A0AAN7KH53_9MYRT|nr:hypothetical protein SAY87_007809 [Trapa incisa]